MEWSILWYSLYSILLTFYQLSQNALHCFQVLSSDAHTLYRKEPGGQTHPVRSPTILYPQGEPYIRGCSSAAYDRKAATFSNKLNSRSVPNTNSWKSPSPHRMSLVLLPALLEQHTISERQDQRKTTQDSKIFSMNSTELRATFGQIASLLWVCFWDFLLFCLCLHHLWQNCKDCPVNSLETLINVEVYTSSTKRPDIFSLIFLYTSPRKQQLSWAVHQNRTGP